MPGDTIPTGLLSTFDVGFFGGAAAPGTIHHHDLGDLGTVLDSFQTPLFSSAPKVRARDVVHSWLVDSLTATATAAIAEGIDFSADTLGSPTRLMNVDPIFSQHVVVSGPGRAPHP